MLNLIFGLFKVAIIPCIIAFSILRFQTKCLEDTKHDTTIEFGRKFKMEFKIHDKKKDN